MLQRSLQDLSLRREMAIEPTGLRGEPRGLLDIAHPRRSIATLGEQAKRGGEESPSGVAWRCNPWVINHNRKVTAAPRRAREACRIRLDEEAERALSRLEASGMNRSEAIRKALVASAQMLRRRQQIADEVAALEADEADREEMLEVASLMESLRAQG